MADSAFVTIVAPTLYGAWVHDPANPSTVERQFLYTDGGGEDLDIDEALLTFVGRKYPVLESGQAEDQSVQTVIKIPFGADHRTAVEWWRARKRAGATLWYRDGRGRAFPAAISGKVSVGPTNDGATIGVTFQRVDYPANPTLPAADYNPASPSDGGYGTGGYGVTGYGL